MPRLSVAGRSRAGFTFVEALTALMLVVLVAAAVSTGIAFAAREYSDSVQTSEAIVLQSTLKNAIANELSITNYIEVGPKRGDGSHKLIRFFSANYGVAEGYSEFKVVDGSGSYGELALGTGDDPDTWKKLVSGSAYPAGLGAKVQVYYYEGKKVDDPNGAEIAVPSHFEVKLELGNVTQGTLFEDTFGVELLNEVEPIEV